MWVKSRGTLKVEDQQFGVWLRAVTPSMSQRTVIWVAGMDEEDIVVKDDQQNAKEGMVEGNESGERRNMTAEDVRVAWHGEEDIDVSDKIKEGVVVMESPMNPNSINDDYPIMDITSNSLAHLNLGTNSQRADFSEQLEDIDKELLKFDNVHVSGVISGDSVSKEDLGLQRVSSVIGLEVVGLHFNYDVAKEKSMTPKRGWVRREQNRGEPSGQTSSLLKKRTSRKDDVETETIERCRKKLIKENISSKVEAKSQPHLDQ